MEARAPVVDRPEDSPLSGRGDCIWCELGIAHPAGSGCPDASMRAPVDNGEIARFGEAGEFVLRLATTEDDRLACWHLVYREYLEHGYTQPQAFEYRYSLHDALPHTATFLVETGGKVVGTVTVFPDSPLGLPADEMYREELDGLRRAGRTPVEIGRLTIAREHMNERCVLMNLFDALSLYARCRRRATDLVITVNPSHAKFYERMILFEQIGGERSLGSVCEAPAVLLRLDLGLEIHVRRWAHGEGSKPETAIGRHTAYPFLSGRAEEGRRVEAMRRIHRKPDEDFVRRYFVCLKPLIPGLPSPLRYFFEQCYPGLDWDPVASACGPS